MTNRNSQSRCIRPIALPAYVDTSLFIKGKKSMDGFLSPERVNWPQLRMAEIGSKPRRWTAHSAHGTIAAPHRRHRPWGAHPSGVQGDISRVIVLAR